MANSLRQRRTEQYELVGGVDDENSDDRLELVRQQFRDAEEASQEERREAREARDYYDGRQWTAEEAAKLRKRKQPVTVDNKIKDKVEFMLGMERKTRTDPKCFPRNPGSDEAQAEAATDALRFICDDNGFDFVCSGFSENLFIEGRGGCEACVDPYFKGPVPRVVLKKLPYDRSYVDPHSRELDYSDKRFCGLITWMDLDEAKALYPDQEAVLEASFNRTFVNEDTYEDRPYFFHKSGRRKRVQVFQHYYRQADVWNYCEFVAGGFLREPEVSYYLEFESGEPMAGCPMEFQALYREPETGNAYSLVRRYKDLQDEWNKRRSKALHLLNTKQAIGERGFAGSSNKQKNEFRTQLNSPDGLAETVPGLEYEVKDGIELSQAQLNMMILAGQSLEASGPNAALAGLSGDISGRAKQLDQEGGLVAIDYPFDAIRSLKHRVFRQAWHRVKQFWDAEMWIRVRDEQQLKFIALNKQTTRGEIVAAEIGKQQDIADEQKAAMIAALSQDPAMQLPVVVNDVAEIDVDIIIEETPNVASIQQEQFQQLVDLVKSGAVRIPPQALIEASQLRNKRRILELMSGADDPMAQRMKMLEEKLLQLDALQKEADAAKTMAQARQAEASAEESGTDAAIKTAEFIRGDNKAPAKKQVTVQ